LSGRGLCDELITRPEESYRLCCVVVCDLETSRMGAPYIYDTSRLRVKWATRVSISTCPETFASPGITSVLLHLCPRAGIHLSESSLWRCYLSRYNHSPVTRCREKQIQSIYRLTIECWQALSLRWCWNTLSLSLSLSLDSITLALQEWDQIKRFILSIGK